MLDVDIGQRLGAFQLEAAFTSAAPVVALFGRSGSGKTSIVNAIAGVTRPDRGRIVVDGEVFFDAASGIFAKPEARRVGYVFQDGLLFPHMSVERNLFYGSHHGSSAAIDPDRVITLLGLKHLLARKPANLSGGEKQRVAFGRALLANPRLLLLDEPLAALDSQRKSEILQYIELLRDEFRIPIVLVSHSMEEVARLADTMVLLSDGRVVAVGGVEELMARMDLKPITGRYEGGAVIETVVASHHAAYDLTELAFDGGCIHAPGVDALIGERVRVRVRARDVSLALSRPEDVSVLNILEGTVAELREESGPIVDVRVQVGAATLIARITRQSVDRLRIQPGLRVFAMVKAISLDRHSVGYA